MKAEPKTRPKSAPAPLVPTPTESPSIPGAETAEKREFTADDAPDALGPLELHAPRLDSDWKNYEDDSYLDGDELPGESAFLSPRWSFN